MQKMDKLDIIITPAYGDSDEVVLKKAGDLDKLPSSILKKEIMSVLSDKNKADEILDSIDDKYFEEDLIITVFNISDVTAFDAECRLYCKNIKGYLSKILRFKIKS